MHLRSIQCECGGVVCKPPQAAKSQRGPLYCTVCGKIPAKKIGGKLQALPDAYDVIRAAKEGDLRWCVRDSQNTELRHPATDKLQVCLELGLDEDAESPLSFDDTWKLVTFNMGLIYDVPSDWKLEDEELPGEFRGRRVWELGCVRHSGSHWFLTEDKPLTDPWDTRRRAGCLLLRRPENIPEEQHTEAARELIEEYNAWTGGDCWWASMKVQIQRPTDPKIQLHHPCPFCQCGAKHGEREFLDEERCHGFIGEQRVMQYLTDLVRVTPTQQEIHPDRHRIVLSIRSKYFFSDIALRTDLEALGYEVECNSRPRA